MKKIKKINENDYNACSLQMVFEVVLVPYSPPPPIHIGYAPGYRLRLPKSRR